MGHDVDLALLTVEDDAFWVGTDGPMKPLKLGDVPQLQVGFDLLYSVWGRLYAQTGIVAVAHACAFGDRVCGSTH